MLFRNLWIESNENKLIQSRKYNEQRKLISSMKRQSLWNLFTWHANVNCVSCLFCFMFVVTFSYSLRRSVMIKIFACGWHFALILLGSILNVFLLWLFFVALAVVSERKQIGNFNASRNKTKYTLQITAGKNAKRKKKTNANFLTMISLSLLLLWSLLRHTKNVCYFIF